jgi:hypothetical protein
MLTNVHFRFCRDERSELVVIRPPHADWTPGKYCFYSYSELNNFVFNLLNRYWNLSIVRHARPTIMTKCMFAFGKMISLLAKPP